MWHYGDYNFRGRVKERKDVLGASIARGRVVESAMLLAALFNKQFAPYWKWLSWKFRQLPRIAPELLPLLDELEAADELQAQTDTIRDICQFYRQVLHEYKIFPDARWRNFMGAPDIIENIKDQEIRALVKKHFML